MLNYVLNTFLLTSMQFMLTIHPRWRDIVHNMVNYGKKKRHIRDSHWIFPQAQHENLK